MIVSITIRAIILLYQVTVKNIIQCPTPSLLTNSLLETQTPTNIPKTSYVT